MKYETQYKTRDFYSSTIIIASGIPLHQINRVSGKTLEFVFLISSLQVKDLIQKHWNRELLIPTRDLIDAINELKTRMHDRNLNAT